MGEASGVDATLARLDDQIEWYGRRSEACQQRFKSLKAVQLIAAAALPILAPFGVSAVVPAAIGSLIVVLEGFQQLGQYQQNWVSYRSTCEALKHEKHLFLAGAGPYADPAGANRLLAERVEDLVSQEHATWVSARHEGARALDAAARPEERGRG